KKDSLVFSFPGVHPQAQLTVTFQRTLRIPDDDRSYPLPPGLGAFPLKHVDDYADTVPSQWIEHGGVMLPMYQSEALWVNFKSQYIDEHGTSYPFAIKIAAGKINAVTGKDWSNNLNQHPQDYLVAPEQPWLDGYCVEKGLIRQFVAMPLGDGYTAEEQITGKGEHGGLQVMVCPMKRDVFERLFPSRKVINHLEMDACYDFQSLHAVLAEPQMGLAPGGKMRQEIYDDPFGFDSRDSTERSRCFVHTTNSLVWRAITNEAPPSVPLTSREYQRYGLPWFDYYDDHAVALEGSDTLKKLKSILQLAKLKGTKPLPENESVELEHITMLGPKRKHQVREGCF
ncbi:MAG TPA: hypothetical protein PKJ77_05030, partial [Thermodesulfobacteriota bacterium]|nr:hypothetical protein [Thermodesulfobacteriota bacterium]